MLPSLFETHNVEIGYARFVRRVVSLKQTGEELGPSLEVAWFEVSDGEPGSVMRLICTVIDAAIRLAKAGLVSSTYFELIDPKLEMFLMKNIVTTRLTELPFVYVIRESDVRPFSKRLCARFE